MNPVLEELRDKEADKIRAEILKWVTDAVMTGSASAKSFPLGRAFLDRMLYSGSEDVQRELNTLIKQARDQVREYVLSLCGDAGFFFDRDDLKEIEARVPGEALKRLRTEALRALAAGRAPEVADEDEDEEDDEL